MYAMHKLTSMRAMLCDVVVVIRTRPRAIYRLGRIIIWLYIFAVVNHLSGPRWK